MTNDLKNLRSTSPLVHCITNYVAMNIAANTLLAAGASPAMIHTPEETDDFARIVGALTVNIGTISPAWLEGMRRGIFAASEAGVPWVLDPVAHFATPYRSAAARELLEMRPTILRGNASEILALGGGQSEAKGVDAKDPVAAAEAAGIKLAQQFGCVVVITSDVDVRHRWQSMRKNYRRLTDDALGCDGVLANMPDRCLCSCKQPHGCGRVGIEAVCRGGTPGCTDGRRAGKFLTTFH